MEPTIISRPALIVVGMRILTRPMSPEIPALWSRFARRIPEIDAILEPDVSYGVMASMPAGDAGLSYMAAVSVASTAARIPSGMTAETIPAGRYAVFEFPLSDVAAAFHFAFGTWLPSSGYTQAQTPVLERYDERFDPAVPSSRMEACIPIRELPGHP